MFQFIVALHLANALLCCTIAALAIRSMRRAPSWQPLAGWSFISFITVYALTSVQRAGFPLLPRWEGWMVIGTTMSFLAAGLLALVFVQAARRSRVALLVVEEARYNAREYERARRDYEQLVRHRIANPLAVVQGVALTLLDHPELPADTRRSLITSLVAASEELVDVSLEPQQRSVEEHELHAVPRASAHAGTFVPDAESSRPREATAIPA